MRGCLAVRILVRLVVVGALCWGRTGWPETLVQQNVDYRVTLAFRVSPSELQSWLPAPWQVNPLVKGPSQNANLIVTFGDQFLIQDAEGKPIGGGNSRFVSLAVSVKHGQTGEIAPMAIRIYTANPQNVPGPYKNSVLMKIRREATVSGADLDPGTGSEAWTVEDGAGRRLDFRVDYQRGIPSRTKSEIRPHSSVDPDFFRIYRADEGADAVKSIPLEINRVQSYHFHTTIEELSRLFDGTEQLVSITIRPWYVRQVFLP
jgi:hypothetical protein